MVTIPAEQATNLILDSFGPWTNSTRSVATVSPDPRPGHRRVCRDQRRRMIAYAQMHAERMIT
jgi:hypothetical protein